MSTLQEIKSAIANLSPHDKALLTAELFAMNAEPDSAALEAALERGLKDVEAGRVHPVEEVKTMLPRGLQSPDCVPVPYAAREALCFLPLRIVSISVSL